MIERDKQRDDQRAKHARKKERKEHPKGDAKTQASEKQADQAGIATDPQSMQDQGYVERIDEKTEKH